MTVQSRRLRGRQSEKIVAAFLRDHGFPMAEAQAPSTPGSDVVGIVGVDVEVFARRGGLSHVLNKFRQALKRPGDIHMAVMRPDGYGEEKAPVWLAIFPLAQAAQLLRDAGYGTPDNKEAQ